MKIFPKNQGGKKKHESGTNGISLENQVQPRAENAGGQDCLQLCRGNPGNNRINYCDSPSLTGRGYFFVCQIRRLEKQLVHLSVFRKIHIDIFEFMNIMRG